MIADETDCEKILKLVTEKNLKPLRRNIAVVDYFEEGGSVMLKDIATPLVWKKYGVENFTLPMIDKSAIVPVECVLLVLDVMHECRQSGFSYFIHCKAGKGRSALMEAAYIALFEKDSHDEDPKINLQKAIRIIERKRGQIVIDAEKFGKGVETIIIARKILAHVEKNKLENKEQNNSKISVAEVKESKADDVLQSLNQLLADTLIKVEIAQLTSFKQLAIYAASNDTMVPEFLGIITKRTMYIANLFEQIYFATNASWLFNYENLTRKFLQANPKKLSESSAEEDAQNRAHLVIEFYNEVQCYLEVKLKCEKGLLKKLLVKHSTPVSSSVTHVSHSRLTSI